MTRSSFMRFRAFPLVGLVGLAAALSLPPIVVPSSAQQPPAAQPDPAADAARFDTAIAQLVMLILEKGHLHKPKINEELSREWFDNYFKQFDPQKVFFLKDDLVEFEKDRDRLAVLAQGSDLSFSRRVFETYVKRHDERLAVILDLIAQGTYDFSADETMETDPDTYDWALNVEQLNERWRKRIKYDLLQAKIDGDDLEKAKEKLTIRYRDRNRFVHQMDKVDVLEIYLSAMTSVVDPHSTYLGPRAFDDMINQDIRLQLEGIGARLRSENGYAVVEEVVPGGAADKDGRLHAEDKIVGVEREDGSIVDFVEMRLSDVVRYIRGPRGTKVKLLVIPVDSKERVTYEITREKIDFRDQRAKNQILDLKDRDNNPVKVGVIEVPSFYGDTEAVLNGDPNATSVTLDVRNILRDFRSRGVNIVLIDLRGNGGGLLTEAESLSGLFIDKGPVVQVKNALGVTPREDTEPGVAWNGPLAVLISKTSASASEIFAGVIQDYERGLILGDSSTFGKGTVQTIIDIKNYLRDRNVPSLGALKLTIQQFYRADGASTQIKGVEPDVVLPSLLDQLDIGEGKLDHALPFDRVEARPHDRFGKTSPELVTQLNTLSKQRRDANDEFKKLNERIRKYMDQKNSKTVSLNEKTYRERYLSEDELEETAEDRARKKKEKKEQGIVWDSNYYNDEVVNVVLDYLKLGGAQVSTPLRAAVR